MLTSIPLRSISVTAFAVCLETQKNPYGSTLPTGSFVFRAAWLIAYSNSKSADGFMQFSSFSIISFISKMSFFSLLSKFLLYIGIILGVKIILECTQKTFHAILNIDSQNQFLSCTALPPFGGVDDVVSCDVVG